MALTAEPGVAARLAAFAVALVAVFGAAFGVGRALGPFGDDPATTPGAPSETPVTGGHDTEHDRDHDTHGG